MRPESDQCGDQPLTILWQEGDCLAVHKPAGWLVHRTGLDAGETRFVVQTLRDQLGQRVHPVHRLDKGTSGVLLMALSSEAARGMAALFEARAVRKQYVALVRGWPAAQARVAHALRPDDAPPTAPAQEALTDIRRLATIALDVPVDRYPQTRAALVLAEPHTGRRHQIRRHLKHLSHPIVGDATHGKGAHNRWWAAQLGMQRLWLHAWQLQFTPPGRGQAITLSSPLPWPGPALAQAACGVTVPDEAAVGLNADWQALFQWGWTWSMPGGSLQPA